MKMLRTYMYVPGIQERMLAKAPERGADAYVLDSAYEEGERSGKGAVALNGRMIDRPVVERARRLLALTRDEIPS